MDYMPNVTKVEVHQAEGNCESFKDDGKKQLKFGCYCLLSKTSSWTLNKLGCFNATVQLEAINGHR
jgi:hypothetical protein